MESFRSDFVNALKASPKVISPKWFYDAEGSRLFEEITGLEEYYPTRQETALLKRVIPLWRSYLEPDGVLVELGSGASAKTRILLDRLDSLAAYIPLDISETALEEAAETLRADYPDLDIRPVLGDFQNLPDLPQDLGGGPMIGFFPGSTLGNLERDEAVTLMASMRRILGPGSRFILGVDLIKDRETLEAAYDDKLGITAAFNFNLLDRANNELGANFAREDFVHKVVWNEALSRVEMHLVANRDVTVHIEDQAFHFDAGESLHTESSRKFDRQAIEQIAAASGWKIEDMQISPKPSVALFLLTSTG